MKETFQIRADFDAAADDEQGTAFIVELRSAKYPNVAVHLRVLACSQFGLNELQMTWVQLTPDHEDVAVHEVMLDKGWWADVLDAVLEYVIFNKTCAIEHVEEATEEFGEDDAVLYRWVGGDVVEARFEPAPSFATDDQLDLMFGDFERLLATASGVEPAQDGDVRAEGSEG